MRSQAILLLTVCLWASCQISGAVDVTSSVEEVAGETPLVDESYVGFDLHKDYFYFDDKLVDDAYARRKYVATKITLAGQNADMTGREVKLAVNPFVVAQKAMHSFGVGSDRWDVKEDFYHNQYLALYHGDKRDFVVNKLRGHLLRGLVNTIQDQLLVLDRETEAATARATNSNENASEGDSTLDVVVEKVKQLITEFIVDIDENIRSTMHDNDASSSTATIAIVTQNNVITINVGSGKVLAYDNMSEVSELTRKPEGLDNCRAIGDLRNRNGMCLPAINITPRVSKVYLAEYDDEDIRQLQFLVIESPFLAGLISDDAVAKTVVRQANQHGADSTHEQELYTSSAIGVLQMATSRFNPIQRIAQADQSIIMVGLTTKYDSIH